MDGTAKPDYATCVKISTDASIKEMIPPGALVMLTPLIVGTFWRGNPIWGSCWVSCFWCSDCYLCI
ncbi:unnamed protein product [Musa acuminata subsp. malaccensis]|uniref:H(+)-exporting diphosphatase n=1 Tax=Musa acuminata subsp. malaccensis TaxID=214687 RepID=A0A804IEE3_MUSAM|nr:unnamed protein product [Musa acuminata subsp. malaccensis]